jgi:ankyrin repeat protein
MTPEEQKDLDNRLIWAAFDGDTETVQMLLSAGADVHARTDYALHAAARNGHTETVKILAKHIFAPDSWRGKNRADIEGEAYVLYNRTKVSNPLRPISPENLHKAAEILADCALRCWEQVRPPPPKIQISPLPAQPRAL